MADFRPKHLVVILLTAFLVGSSWISIHALAEEKNKDVLAGPKVSADERGASSRRFDGSRRRGGFRGQRHDFNFRGVMKQLDLDENQRTEVKKVFEQHRQASKQWHEQNGEKLNEMRSKMQKLRKEIHQLTADAPKPQAALAKIRPLLNEQQKRQLDETMSKQKQRRGQPDRRERGKRLDRRDRDRNSDRRKDSDDRLDL